MSPTCLHRLAARLLRLSGLAAACLWLALNPAWANIPTNLALRDPGDPPYQESHRQIDVNGRPAYLRVYQYYGERQWADYVLDLVGQALPLLEQDLGMAVPYRQIVLIEARESEEGIVGTASGATIRLATNATEHTVLHELAHLWLDHNFHEQWVREGFADVEAYRTMQAMGMSSDLLQQRYYGYRSRCGAGDWPLTLWNSSPNLDLGCAYGKSATFATLLYQVLGDDMVHNILQQLYAAALQGRSFQEELRQLYPQASPDLVARLFSGWVNQGAYYYPAPNL